MNRFSKELSRKFDAITRARDLASDSLADLNREHIADDDCTLYTDDFPTYDEFEGYEHRKLNRYSKKEYSRREIHINTAEGVFSLLKSCSECLEA